MTYKCHKCESIHTTENVAAFCAECYSAEKARVRNAEVKHEAEVATLKRESDGLLADCDSLRYRLEEAKRGLAEPAKVKALEKEREELRTRVEELEKERAESYGWKKPKGLSEMPCEICGGVAKHLQEAHRYFHSGIRFWADRAEAAESRVKELEERMTRYHTDAQYDEVRKRMEDAEFRCAEERRLQKERDDFRAGAKAEADAGDAAREELKKALSRLADAEKVVNDLRSEFSYIADALHGEGNLWDWRGAGDREDLMDYLHGLAAHDAGRSK